MPTLLSILNTKIMPNFDAEDQKDYSSLLTVNLITIKKSGGNKQKSLKLQMNFFLKSKSGSHCVCRIFLESVKFKKKLLYRYLRRE
jgi:hypothetical protein